jgi:hypothetical protein
VIDEADVSSTDGNFLSSDEDDANDNYDLMDSFVDQQDYTCDGEF